MRKLFFSLVFMLATLSVEAETYVVYVKAPVCETEDYRPVIVGSFEASQWSNNIEMTLLTEGPDRGSYYAQFEADSSDPNERFKIREASCTGSDWSNELVWWDSNTSTWRTYGDFYLVNFNGETEISLDFAMSTQGWKLCHPDNPSSGGGEEDGPDPLPLPDPNPNDPDMSQQHDMPVIYINTKNYQSVVSKENYLKATYWLDSRGVAGVSDVASAEKPDTLQIKGRGNYTWTGFAKKPYRLKLDKKTGLLGMKKSKHFGLLAHSDDWSGWMKNTLGFTLSKQLGLPWTPDQRPVEVVLNNKYMGLYMLTELVRVDKDRVNVFEQPDECQDADTITGGWLVEIDNYGYQEPYHVHIYGDDDDFYVTPKTPEILNSAQLSYLANEILNITDLAYAQSEQLYEHLDMRDAARFYLVQELMCDCEAYTGSCYLHKQMLDPVWHFGPVWDFGNAYNRYYFSDSEDVRHQFQYINPEFNQHLIPQLIQMPQMQEELQKAWNHWRYYDYENALQTITDMYDAIHNAAGRDPLAVNVQADINNGGLGWCIHTDIDAAEQLFTSYFIDRVNWLTSIWGQGEADVEDLPANRDSRSQMSKGAYKVLRDGQVIIIRNGVEYSILGL